MMSRVALFRPQARNKPKQPPKAPKAAPFFLPTVAGLELQFAAPCDENTAPEVSTPRPRGEYTLPPR